MTNPALPTLAFIGGGNMAKALVGGLLGRGGRAPDIWVADPGAEQRSQLAADYPAVHVTADNLEAATAAPVWVLAVKPQQMPGVARGLQPAVASRQPLVLSVAAGIRASDLGRWLGPGATIVRTMPNRPALVGAGVTALYAQGSVGGQARETCEAIMAAVGRSVWVDSDDQIDMATAISGSGPAYFLRLMELLEDAGAGLGLPREVARLLALETAFGTAQLARESARPCAELRAEVTSAGGTTAAALAVFEASDLRGIVANAVAAAHSRAGELAAQYGAQP